MIILSTTVNLYSDKKGEIIRFLNSFYNNNNFDNTELLKWEKTFENPVEISDIIGTFIENNEKFKINMWVSFDKNIFINITDNNVDKTSSLEYFEGEDKYGNLVVNYIYRLSNINATHTLVVSSSSAASKIYLKINNNWVEYEKVYLKVNGSWVEQDSSTWSTLFDVNANYRKMN